MLGFEPEEQEQLYLRLYRHLELIIAQFHEKSAVSITFDIGGRGANTFRYVADKDMKAFATDLKTIYHALDGEQGKARMHSVAQVWDKKYPGCMRCREDNWDVISPVFKFSSAVRKVIFTTNAIESLNSGYRRLSCARSVFPSGSALLKALYLATFELTKKWTLPLRKWGQVHSELAVMYPGRMA